jgi:hypothetical protein
LQRWYGIDYRDRWRFDERGARKLTLRRISVLVRHLPSDSATAIATGGHGWTLADHLLADVYHATSGNLHPWKPEQDKGSDPAREKAKRAARARARERQRAIDAGEIT